MQMQLRCFSRDRRYSLTVNTLHSSYERRRTSNLKDVHTMREYLSAANHQISRKLQPLPLLRLRCFEKPILQLSAPAHCR